MSRRSKTMESIICAQHLKQYFTIYIGQYLKMVETFPKLSYSFHNPEFVYIIIWWQTTDKLSKQILCFEPIP